MIPHFLISIKLSNLTPIREKCHIVVAFSNASGLNHDKYVYDSIVLVTDCLFNIFIRCYTTKSN